MTIGQRLSLLWRRFSPLEDRLLAAVRNVLPAAAVSIFDEQVRAIAHVQRLPGWTEIDYYPRRRGRVDWASVPLFPRRGEFPLARVGFAVERRRYRATLGCVAGHIFDFGITPGPQRIAFADWDSPPTADLLSDPFRTDAESGHEIPAAWRSVLGRAAAPAVATGWVLHDARTVRVVTLEEGQFLVLAERGADEFILHRVEPPSEVMFRLASHDGTPEPIRGDVAVMLQRA
jgi:hypothetical protein